MSNEVISQPAFRAMHIDIPVSMDDVVSAFVSQYENNLYARKKELSTEISANEKTLEKLDEAVREHVTGKEFEYDLPLSLTITVKQGSPNYTVKQIPFEIVIEDKEQKGYYGNQIKLTRVKKIPAKYVNQHDKVVETLDGLRAELSEVLVALKSVTRKERQVRGRIAMKKLEDSGYESLMQDQELIQLVQLDD